MKTKMVRVGRAAIDMRAYDREMAAGYKAARKGSRIDAEFHFDHACGIAIVEREVAKYDALARVTWTIAHAAAEAAADTVRKAFNPPVGQVRG